MFMFKVSMGFLINLNSKLFFQYLMFILQKDDKKVFSERSTKIPTEKLKHFSQED